MLFIQIETKQWFVRIVVIGTAISFKESSLMRVLLLLIFFTLFVSERSYSQVEITGSVTEIESGEGLPAATVLIVGSYRGTITNNEGFFSLNIDSLPVTLQFRYIGFETQELTIQKEPDSPFSIEMIPSIASLGEITVTGDDPGLSIMELVIERKKIWRSTLNNYQVDAYTRQSLSNDTSIVSITESSSIAYWDRIEGHREVQLTRRQTMNITEDNNFAGVRYLPNFYDDNIEIAGYNLVGITHPNTTRYYGFKLLDTQQMDGKPLYKIEVIPKRTRQPLFEGIAWVLGRDYALLEVVLTPNDVVSFPPPIQDFNLAYKQQFSNYGGEYWLPVDMRIEGLIRIGMIGLQFPSMKFSQISRLSDYEINTSIPDSIFSNEEFLVRADSSEIEGQTLSSEPIPLTEEEMLAYETIDSTKTIEEAFKPEGFLAKMIEDDTSEDSERSGLSNLIPNGLTPRWRYNRMDGHHVGLNYQKRVDEIGLSTEIFAGYSFHSQNWDYGISFSKKLIDLNGSAIDLLAGYEEKTDTRYQSELYRLGFGSINTFIGGGDYFDYFRNEKMTAGLRLQSILPRTDFTINFHRELQSSFDNVEVFDNSLFGNHDPRRDNIAIEDGILHSVKFELGYNVEAQNYGFTGKRQIRLISEFSNESIGSDFNFSKHTVKIDWNLNTFYQRRLFANTLDFHLTAGTSIGELPLQRFGAIDGSMNRFTPFGSLKTRYSLPYEGNRFWLATAEHNFRTIPFELLGLRYLVEKGWGLILFGGAGYAEADGDYPDTLLTSDGVHSEVGISLNGIFGLVRLDFAKRLDRPGSFIGFSVARYF